MCNHDQNDRSRVLSRPFCATLSMTEPTPEVPASATSALLACTCNNTSLWSPFEQAVSPMDHSMRYLLPICLRGHRHGWPFSARCCCWHRRCSAQALILQPKLHLLPAAPWRPCSLASTQITFATRRTARAAQFSKRTFHKGAHLGTVHIDPQAYSKTTQRGGVAEKKQKQNKGLPGSAKAARCWALCALAA